MANGTAVREQAHTEVDEAFIDRALDDADMNALRMALYQATGDESLLAIPLKNVPVYGGATMLTEVADDAVGIVRAKAKEFLRELPAVVETVPDDAQLRRMLEAFRDETLSEQDWAYRRALPAFEDFPRLARWSGDAPQLPEGFEVAIVGAGYAGIAMGVQLVQLGIPFTIYERRDELGGVWSINTYPDVRVDTHHFLYQFFFEKKYPWTQWFPRGHEVREYLERVAKKHGVYDHISFGSDVEGAVFDEPTGTWELSVRVGGEVRRTTVTAVVAASGTFANPKRPDIPGLDVFRGQVIHTAECDGTEDFTGKAVAVIGNGSTGVQMLSAVHRQCARLGVFQRTPQWIAPRERYGDPVIPETRWLIDTMPYYWNWYCYSIATMRLAGQLTQEPDPEWKAKGGLVNEANDNVRATLTAYIDAKVGHRPDLRDRLVPDYAPMARRMVVDNGWYATLLEDDVELVTDPIERITETGIRTADGVEREYDVILLATGFEVEKYLFPAQYRGLHGQRLEDLWTDPAGDGPRAHLSLTVPDFPNLFIMYGPNSQNRAGSLIVWVETWAKYIGEALVALVESGGRYVNVRREAFEDYNAKLDEAMAGLIWYDEGSRHKNYYVNSFGRQQVNVPWRLEKHHELLSHFRPEEYDIV
ncbi:MAG: NAD(P)/FAD-dependent oxidoreductase [Microbacterium sp.]